MSSPSSACMIFLVGASRGIGLGLAKNFLSRGWSVIGTVRGGLRDELDELAEHYPGRLITEKLDMVNLDRLRTPGKRLSGRRLDILFVGAGSANMEVEPAAVITDQKYARVLVTNALGPMRVIDAFQSQVNADGVISVMSSGQGGITHNTNGLHELYRSSKTALNQLVRSYAAHHETDTRAIVLMATGWIRARLGGPRAPFTVEESARRVADVLTGRRGVPGLAYIDRHGGTVPW